MLQKKVPSISSTTTTASAAASAQTPKRHALTKPVDAPVNPTSKPKIRKPREPSHHFPKTVADQVARGSCVVSGMRADARAALTKYGEEVVITLYVAALNSATNNKRTMPNVNDMKVACETLGIKYDFRALEKAEKAEKEAKPSTALVKA